MREQKRIVRDKKATPGNDPVNGDKKIFDTTLIKMKM
jgi:hypothetical protein